MDGSGGFRPWTWEERQGAIKAVQEKIQSLPEGTTKPQAHGAALKLLANVVQARQLHQPAIGRLVETGTVDPLHLMNNAWQHLFTCIAGVLISQSQQTVDGEYDKDSPIVCFLVFLKKNLHLNRLRRTLDEWMKSHDGDKAPALQIRLNGLESRKFCQNVMGIINCLAPNARGSPRRLAVLHSLAYIALKLHDVVALFSRYTITDDEVEDLEKKCRLYFNAAVLFLEKKPTPSVWTIGHVVPAHTKELKRQLGFGLGIGTTQGRGAKVIIAKKYLEHTMQTKRFEMFFRHEFLHLVWYLQQNPDDDDYHESKESYMPPRCGEKDVCDCGQRKEEEKESCDFCAHRFRALVNESAESGRVVNQLSRILRARRPTMMFY